MIVNQHILYEVEHRHKNRELSPKTFDFQVENGKKSLQNPRSQKKIGYIFIILLKQKGNIFFSLPPTQNKALSL